MSVVAIVVLGIVGVLTLALVTACIQSSRNAKRQAKEEAGRFAKEFAAHFVGDESKVGTVFPFTVAPFEVRVKLTQPVEGKKDAYNRCVSYAYTGEVEIVYPSNWELKKVDILPNYHRTFGIVAAVKGGPEQLTAQLSLPGNITPVNGLAGILWTRQISNCPSSQPL